MKKICFILGFIFLFISCVKSENKLDHLENLNILGFQFGATENEIVSSEKNDLIEKSNVFAVRILSYKELFYGIESTVQYELDDDSLFSVSIYFDFEGINFKDILKEYQKIENKLYAEYGTPNFKGFKNHNYPGSVEVNKDITDPSIYDDIANEKCVYLVEWFFEKQVSIQLLIQGQIGQGVFYYLNFTDPKYMNN